MTRKKCNVNPPLNGMKENTENTESMDCFFFVFSSDTVM